MSYFDKRNIFSYSTGTCSDLYYPFLCFGTLKEIPLILGSKIESAKSAQLIKLVSKP